MQWVLTEGCPRLSLLSCSPQPALSDDTPVVRAEGHTCFSWGDVGANGLSIQRHGDGWSKCLPILPMLQLCHVPAKISDLRWSSRSSGFLVSGQPRDFIVQQALLLWMLFL